MKKILFCVMMLVAMSASAQFYDTIYDTIVGRSPYYHYSIWYDTCPYFDNGVNNGNDPRVKLKGHPACQTYMMHADSTMGDTLMVKGLSCMVYKYDTNNNYLYNSYFINPVRLPEYLLLGRYDEKLDTFMVTDSLRWDTVTPKLMMLPRHADTSAGYERCWAYEVYFDHPIAVCGAFHIAGTYNSSDNPGVTTYYPTNYVGIDYSLYCRDMSDPICIGWLNPLDFVYEWEPRYHKWHPYYRKHWTNPFHLIVQPKRMVDAVPCDTAWGRVEGGGQRYDSTYIALTAVPRRGYAFSHWNDGVTANPRTVHVTSDTSFVAYFSAKAVYRLELATSQPALTTVVGDDLYYEGDTATIRALASFGFAFERWSDGDTNNPRQVVVESDTAFTALFRMKDFQGVDEAAPVAFSLTPNPARDRVVLTCPSDLTAEAVVCNAMGNELIRAWVDQGRAELSTAALPAGVYFVTLTFDDGRYSVRRLVVE